MKTKNLTSKPGTINGEKLKETGPFDRANRSIFIYSIGASNEGHGRALPSNIDDYMAIYTATHVSRHLGYNYRGHIPYSSDRVGAIAKDWNPAYISMNEMVRKMTRDLKIDIRNLKKNGNPASYVIVISGHGGNNFLKEREKGMSKALNIPFLYVPPFANVHATLKGYGEVDLWHADHGEHSIGLFLGLLDKKKLEEINKVARIDPLEALRRDPPIMGLGFYFVPELSGANKYNTLRKLENSVPRKFINKDKRIIVDYDVGRQFMEGNIESAKKQIKEFIRKG
jgi:creatinine amidohydrolase/Fe(II)-dependent formamide hydrolase-like protein